MKIRSLGLGAGATVFGLSPGAALAQCQPTQSARLDNSVYVSPGLPQSSDEVRGRIVLDGEELLTGCATDWLAAGFVKRFLRASTGQWLPNGTIVAPDATLMFGTSIAASADTLVVGAQRDDERGFDSGAVYVFERSGSDWVFDTKLFGADAGPLDFFGAHVTLAGSRLAVHAMMNAGTPNSVGSVYVFDKTPGGWTERARFDSGSTFFDGFASDVDFAGSDVFVGWARDPALALYAGSVAVYRDTGASFVSLGKLYPPPGVSGVQFGRSIAADRDSLAIGSPRFDVRRGDEGVVFLYRNVGGTWQFERQLLAPVAAYSDNFGSALDLEGDRMLVGASGFDDLDPDIGRAFVFQFDGTTWNATGELRADFPQDGDYFGDEVLLSGDRAVVGAPAGFAQSNHGIVFAFDLACPNDIYCTAKVNSLGCTPSMTYSGVASASATDPFVIGARNVLNFRSGLLFYGSTAVSLPFQDGTLCVGAPVHRTPLQDSGGTAGQNDCTGGYAFDFNARIHSGIDASLVAGAEVFAQHWSRDPAVPSTTGLTDALRFLITP